MQIRNFYCIAEHLFDHGILVYESRKPLLQSRYKGRVLGLWFQILALSLIERDIWNAWYCKYFVYLWKNCCTVLNILEYSKKITYQFQAILWRVLYFKKIMQNLVHYKNSASGKIWTHNLMDSSWWLYHYTTRTYEKIA